MLLEVNLDFKEVDDLLFLASLTLLLALAAGGGISLVSQAETIKVIDIAKILSVTFVSYLLGNENIVISAEKA